MLNVNEEKLKNNKNYVLYKKKLRKKRIIKGLSIVLAALIPTGVILHGNYKSKNNKDLNEYDDSSSILYVDEDEIKGFLNDVYEEYEYDDETLNSYIDQIKNVSYKPINQDFINYDIYNEVSNAINRLGEYDVSLRPNDHEINYEWYNNGKVDSSLLYIKLIKNNKENGLSTNDNVKSIIKEISFGLEKCLDYLKKKYPNYDLKSGLYNLDNLTVKTINESTAYYEPDNNSIKVNLNADYDYNMLKKIICHELTHVITNYGVDGILEHKCIGFDFLDSPNAPIKLNFLYESLGCDIAKEIYGGNYNNIEYLDEKFGKLCKSTGKSKEYFNRCTIMQNYEGLVNCFEPELRDVPLVFSIYDAFNISCDFDNSSNTSYIDDANCYYELALYKNACIKVMKQVYSGNLTKQEATQELENYKSKILQDNSLWYKKNSNIYFNLKKFIDKIDNICYGYHNVKTR